MIIVKILFALLSFFLVQQDTGVILPELETITASNVDQITVIAELEINERDQHAPFPCYMSFNKETTMLAAVGGFCDGLHLWDLTTGDRTVVNTKKLTDNWPCRYCIPLFNTQNEPIVLYTNGIIKWWNAATGFVGEPADEEYKTIYWPPATAFNGNDTLAFIVSEGYPIHLLLLDFESGETIEVITRSTGFGDIEFSPNGEYFAISKFLLISVRETKSPNTEIALLESDSDANWDEHYRFGSLSFSFSGDLLISSDGEIWDTETWEPLTLLDEFDEGDFSVRGISPDRSLLWTAEYLWSVDEGTSVKDLPSPAPGGSAPRGAIISPNWKLIAYWEGDYDEPKTLVLLGIPKVTEPEANSSTSD